MGATGTGRPFAYGVRRSLRHGFRKRPNMTAPSTTRPEPSRPTSPARRRRWPWLLGVVAAFGLGIGAGQAGGDSGDTRPVAQPAPATTTVAVPAPTTFVAAPPATVTVTNVPVPSTVTAAEAPAASSGPASSFGAGQYQVGVDIVAGHYKSAGPSDGSMCYVEVARDDLGSIDSIVTNDIVRGPKTVTVTKGQYVKNSGCQTFTKVR